MPAAPSMADEKRSAGTSTETSNGALAVPPVAAAISAGVPVASSDDEHDALDWLYEVPHSEDDGSWDAFIGRIGPMVTGTTTYRWMLDRHFTEHPEQWQEFAAAGKVGPNKPATAATTPPAR